MSVADSHDRSSRSHLAPRAAVLVLNRNGRRFLKDCFDSLLRNRNSSFDIYLIDNGSDDDSVPFTRERFPMVKIMEHGENLGFAGAYDRAIRRLGHQYIVLLNNDTTVDEHWLKRLVEAAESDKSIAACGSKIVMMWDPEIIDHAGGMLTLIGSGLDQGKWTRDTGRYDKTREVGFASGCSLLLRRNAYLEADGFDADYGFYHEDVDICWRLHLCGYKVVFVHDSLVYHHLGGGKIRGMDNPWKTFLCQKNRLANIIKNMGPAMLLPALSISFAYDGFRCARFLASGRFDLIVVLFKGYAATLGRLRKLMRERRRIRKARSVPEREIKRFFSPLRASATEYLGLLALTERAGVIEKEQSDEANRPRT
jgi:GT2 family glycosyltransferase